MSLSNPVVRPRRSTLAVPGSSVKMLDKARGLNVDEVFMDLEDAVAPIAKEEARKNIVAALNEGGYEGKIVSVRVNDWTTHWAHADVVEVVTGAGAHIDSIMLPKTQSADQVQVLDRLLTELETSLGLPLGGIAIEAQIEDALGLVNVNEIAQSSARMSALIFGPADFMASIGMKSLVVGEQPPGYDQGDAYHYVLMRILIAARAFGLDAIDGPYLAIKDVDGLRKVAQRSAALGFDGKWVLHPDQVDVVNEVFSPTQADFDRAEAILEAYEHATSAEGGAKGAVMLGDEMIDEASRKMALVISAKGRAAGMTRNKSL